MSIHRQNSHAFVQRWSPQHRNPRGAAGDQVHQRRQQGQGPEVFPEHQRLQCEPAARPLRRPEGRARVGGDTEVGVLPGRQQQRRRDPDRPGALLLLDAAGHGRPHADPPGRQCPHDVRAAVRPAGGRRVGNRVRRDPGAAAVGHVLYDEERTPGLQRLQDDASVERGALLQQQRDGPPRGVQRGRQQQRRVM